MFRRAFIATAIVTILTSAASAQDTVKIGLILPMSGQQASTGKQIDAAVKLYMAQHGTTVAGKKIEVILKDDTSVPDVTKRLAQELVVNDKVAVLAGFGITPSAMATAPIAAFAVGIGWQHRWPDHAAPWNKRIFNFYFHFFAPIVVLFAYTVVPADATTLAGLAAVLFRPSLKVKKRAGDVTADYCTLPVPVADLLHAVAVREQRETGTWASLGIEQGPEQAVLRAKTGKPYVCWQTKWGERELLQHGDQVVKVEGPDLTAFLLTRKE